MKKAVDKFAEGQAYRVAGHMKEFVHAFHAMSKVVHRTAVDKGWWDGQDHNVGEKLALIHSEVSEALEAFRHGNPPDDKVPAFSGAEAELADIIIRIMDLAEYFGWDVAGALCAKADYNMGRPHKHGNKDVKDLPPETQT